MAGSSSTNSIRKKWPPALTSWPVYPLSIAAALQKYHAAKRNSGADAVPE